MKSVVKNNIPMEYRSYPTQLEKRNTLLAQLDEILDKAKLEKRNLTPNESKNFEKIKNEIQQLDKELRKDETLVTNETRGNSAQSPQEQEEVRAFVNFVATGEHRDLSSTGSAVIVPKTIADRVIQKVKEISPLYNQLTHYSVVGDLSLPVFDYTAHTTSFVDDFQEIPLSQGTFLTVALRGFNASTLTKIGKSLLAKTTLDVTSVIIEQMALSIADFISKELITNASAKLSGTLQSVTQSVTGAATAPTADNLISLQMAVPSRFMSQSAFLMHPNTFAAIRKLKDGSNNYLMISNNESLRSNVPYTLLGSNVMLDENMPVYGVGARAIYFGDFGSIVCNTNQELQATVLLESFATQSAVGIILSQIFDTNLADTRGLAVLVGA